MEVVKIAELDNGRSRVELDMSFEELQLLLEAAINEALARFVEEENGQV